MSRDTYVRDMRPLVKALDQAVYDLRSPPGAQRPEQTLPAIATGEERLRELAEKLEDVRPPEDVEEDHTALPGLLRAWADRLDRYANALSRFDYSDPDVTEQIEELSRLADSTRPAARGVYRRLQAIRAKGYDIPMLVYLGADG